MRFDRFTEKAQEAIAIAQESLSKFHHTQLDTEHLLWGLLEQVEGLVSQILTRLGVNPETVKSKVEEALKRAPQVYFEGSSPQAQIYITPRAKRVFDSAWEHEGLRVTS